MSRPWRYIETPKVGRLCWVKSRSHPNWWKRQVRIMRLAEEGMVAEIESLNGDYSRRFFVHALDLGREWQTKSGEWIPETDERVKRWLVKAIQDIDAGGHKVVERDVERYREEIRDDLRWVMQRNGWKMPV